MIRKIQILIVGCSILGLLLFGGCKKDDGVSVVVSEQREEVNFAGGKIRFIARVREVSEVPAKQSTGEYKDALAAFVLEPLLPLPGHDKRELITVFAQVMRDREATESTSIEAGEPVTVDIVPMSAAPTQIQTMQRFDTLDVVSGETYYASDLKSRAPVEFDVPEVSGGNVETWNRDDVSYRERLTASEPTKLRAISEMKSIIEAERERYGGSWRAWRDQLSGFREDIQSTANHQWSTGPEVIVAVSMPSFIENPDAKVLPGDELVELANQLAQQGIDFLYVSVPVKIEVYPEKFSSKVPPGMDRVNPAKAEYLTSLLDRGVEVIYLEPAFAEFRSANPDTLLYMPGKDGHFSPAAAALTGEVIAERLRHREYLQSHVGKTRFEIEPEPHQWGSAFGWSETWPVIAQRVKFSESGQFYGNHDGSPVDVVGDSHVLWWQTSMTKNAGVAAHLSRNLGLPVHWEAAKGLQPHFLNRFSPEWYEGKKCVVLLQTSLKIFNLAQPVREVRLQRSRG